MPYDSPIRTTADLLKSWNVKGANNAAPFFARIARGSRILERRTLPKKRGGHFPPRKTHKVLGRWDLVRRRNDSSSSNPAARLFPHSPVDLWLLERDFHTVGGQVKFQP